MPLGLIFWILMLIWFVFGLVLTWWPGPENRWHPVVNTLMLFILFGLLGWKVFGPAIHG